MSFPRYANYKDSDVKWLGEVPGHWEVVRLKNVLQRRITDGPHTTPVFVDEGVPFLSVDGIQDGELQFDGCRFISELDHAEYRKKALPQKDDLLMGKAASTGKIARVKVNFEFSIWSPLALIRLDHTVSNATFFEQSLKSPIVQAQIDNLCTANTQKNISMDDIPKLILTRPPLCEQAKIAAFLDRETAKIDELVAEQQRLMDLLKEKRKAVISHAVTQGLNPDAPMKPSGIEWLGDVPAHWELKATKRLFRLVIEPAPDDNDYELLSIYTEIGVRPRKSLEARGNKATTTDGYWMVQKGDLIVNKLLAWMGAIGISDYDGVTSPAYDILRPKIPLEPRFYDFLFRCGICFSEFRRYSRGIMDMRLRLYFDELGQLFMPYPPLQEQQQIVSYLQQELARFDELSLEAQRVIDLLNERRTALISAAVTGQIDVRALVPTEVFEAAA